MYFKDIIAQQETIERLVQYAQNGTVPHAMLFTGPEGVGKLQTAIAFARYMLCRDRGNGADSCGHCPSCVKMDKLVHPDLHFVYPVINKSKSAGRSTISDDEISPWREIVLENHYFGFEEWLSAIDAENKQARIFVTESESINKKLSLKSVEGGYLLDPETAQKIAHLSAGSWLKAIDTLRINTESEEFLNYFIQFMRLTYARRLKDLKEWSETIASNGREWQKRFLQYCQRMIRENFISNFGRPELNYMTESERQFSVKFAPFVNENNIIGLMETLSDAQRDIEQNVNSKMVFFDLSLKTIMLMKQ